MKKLVAALAAILLLVGASVPAFAAETGCPRNPECVQRCVNAGMRAMERVRGRYQRAAVAETAAGAETTDTTGAEGQAVGGNRENCPYDGECPYGNECPNTGECLNNGQCENPGQGCGNTPPRDGTGNRRGGGNGGNGGGRRGCGK